MMGLGVLPAGAHFEPSGEASALDDGAPCFVAARTETRPKADEHVGFGDAVTLGDSCSQSIVLARLFGGLLGYLLLPLVLFSGALVRPLRLQALLICGPVAGWCARLLWPLSVEKRLRLAVDSQPKGRFGSAPKLVFRNIYLNDVLVVGAD